MKRMQKYYFRMFIISNSQIELLVSFSRSTNVNVNCSFPNSNYEGTFSTYVFGNSFWHYRYLKNESWTSRHLLFKKMLNFFICVEVRIVCKKWNIYEAHIFPRTLQQTCRLETTPLCLNTRLGVKKISKFKLFLLKLCKRLSFMCWQRNDKYNPSYST